SVSQSAIRCRAKIDRSAAPRRRGMVCTKMLAISTVPCGVAVLAGCGIHCPRMNCRRARLIELARRRGTWRAREHLINPDDKAVAADKRDRDGGHENRGQ